MSDISLSAALPSVSSGQHKKHPKRKPVFIEKVMPVKLLNEQVYYEHGGNPFKGLHRWYSRKPLSFSRASVLGSLLPASVTMEEFEYLLGLEPGKEVKLYELIPVIKFY